MNFSNSKNAKLRVATDCSGIEAPLQALKQLKIPYTQLWSSDTCKHTEISRKANYPEPTETYLDMTTRNNKLLPEVDLYVIGFPCQSFSLAGKRLGLKDPRNSVIPSMISTIKYSKPKIFILENVTGFKSIDNGKPYLELMKILEVNYNVSTDIYNTREYNIPQNRKRIYFVGIRKENQIKEFVKPKILKLTNTLDKIINDELIGTKNHISHDKIEKVRRNLDSKYNIINIDFINIVAKSMHEYSPTLMTTPQTPFIYELNRPFNVSELLQLQGFPKNFKVVVSKNQMKKQIGNSMSVNVVKLVIKEALHCI